MNARVNDGPHTWRRVADARSRGSSGEKDATSRREVKGRGEEHMEQECDESSKVGICLCVWGGGRAVRTEEG
eukprot:6207774-Pleurochrysis_carterae.AAC.1